MNEIKLKYDTQVSVVHYESLDSRSFKSFSKPKWSKLVNKLSVPIEANYKYARGVILKTIQMIMVKLSKSIETIKMSYIEM
ncbi:pathogenicity island protein [Staphylococcus aureus]|nr:pathogenicity island protein [Staphylococcus aureus]